MITPKIHYFPPLKTSDTSNQPIFGLLFLTTSGNRHVCWHKWIRVHAAIEYGWLSCIWVFNTTTFTQLLMGTLIEKKKVSLIHKEKQPHSITKLPPIHFQDLQLHFHQSPAMWTEPKWTTSCLPRHTVWEICSALHIHASHESCVSFEDFRWGHCLAPELLSFVV